LGNNVLRANPRSNKPPKSLLGTKKNLIKEAKKLIGMPIGLKDPSPNGVKKRSYLYF